MPPSVVMFMLVLMAMHLFMNVMDMLMVRSVFVPVSMRAAIVFTLVPMIFRMFMCHGISPH